MKEGESSIPAELPTSEQSLWLAVLAGQHCDLHIPFTALADVGASADSLSMSLAAAMLACALGTWLAELAGIPGFSLGLVAIFASGFASLGVAVNSSLDGGKTRSPFQGETRLLCRSLQQLNLKKDTCWLRRDWLLQLATKADIWDRPVDLP